MLVNPGRHGEYIGIKDNIFRRKADTGEQLIGALANLDLALLGIGLTGFIKCHDDHGCAVSHAFSGIFQKFLFAFLHRDGIDDRFARDTFQAGFDHRPFGAVDHHRHAGNIRFGRDELEEGRHRMFGVEQAFIHIHIDDLRTIFDLLPRDFHGGFIVIVEDKLFEPRRTGDIGTLANIDKLRGRGGCGHLQIFLLHCADQRIRRPS